MLIHKYSTHEKEQKVGRARKEAKFLKKGSEKYKLKRGTENREKRGE